MTSRLLFSRAAAALFLSIGMTTPVFAQTTQPANSSDSSDFYTWQLNTSLGAMHFEKDPRHNNNPRLINLEWHRPSYMLGAAYFHNSFDQPSQYLYIGKKFHPFESAPNFFFKVTGGILHGYKDEFEDKVPFNHNGYSPAILPSAGYCYKAFCSELVLFGTAGMMLAVGARFK